MVIGQGVVGGLLLGAHPRRPGVECHQPQAAIHAEVSRLLSGAEDRAVAVLKEHRAVLDRLVDLLVTKEVVDGSEIYALAGRSEPPGSAGVTIAPDRAVAAADDSTSTSDANSEDRKPVGNLPS
jgi:hypothetical protein